MKRIRRAARIIILDPEGRFLLFRFRYDAGPLAGGNYWAVPGGGVEEGESVAEAARRELLEETGISLADAGQCVGRSGYDFRLSTGEDVIAEDSYFLLRLAARPELSSSGFTAEEAGAIAEQRWFGPGELERVAETIVPANFPELARGFGIRV